MDYSLYLMPFLLSFVLAVAFLSALIVAKKLFPGERKSSRHIHSGDVSRSGGIALILAFAVSLFLDPNLFIPPALWGILLASLLILVFGVWDDFKEQDWKSQIFFQILLSVFVFIVGVRVEYVTNPLGGIFNLTMGDFFLPSLLFGIVWMVVFMNSMNWIDGIDGLSSGITLIGAGTIFLLSLKPEVNQPPVAIMAVVLIGAVLALLVFNFYPARIFAGTSGSMFMGFILAVLAIFAGTKIATALLIMIVPIMDALWVILERMRNGQSVFKADKRHLHYKLLELGWSQRRICLFFYAITAVVAVVALNTRSIGKLMTIFLAGAVMVAVFYYVDRKIHSNQIYKTLK